MLRKIFILLLLQVGVYSIYAQSLQKLETNPSFKGISIGITILMAIKLAIINLTNAGSIPNVLYTIDTERQN